MEKNKEKEQLLKDLEKLEEKAKIIRKKLKITCTGYEHEIWTKLIELETFIFLRLLEK